MSTMLPLLPLVGGKQADGPQRRSVSSVCVMGRCNVTLGESQTRLGDAILHRVLTEKKHCGWGVSVTPTLALLSLLLISGPSDVIIPGIFQNDCRQAFCLTPQYSKISQPKRTLCRGLWRRRVERALLAAGIVSDLVFVFLILRTRNGVPQQHWVFVYLTNDPERAAFHWHVFQSFWTWKKGLIVNGVILTQKIWFSTPSIVRCYVCTGGMSGSWQYL